MIKFKFIFLGCVLLISACGNQTNTTTTTGVVDSLLMESLGNAVYPIELTQSGKAQLSDGTFEEESAPGSASKINIALSENIAAGDLDGDGDQDAAVILVADTGGSGTFYYLSAVLFEEENPNPVNSIFIGDRLVIESLSIDSGKISVDLLLREFDEPMSAEPSIETTQIFLIQDGNLAAIQ